MTDDADTILPAVMISTLLETLLFGVFLPLCFKTFIVMSSKRIPRRIPMLAFTTVELLAITSHWAINISRLYGGFIYSSSNSTATKIYYSKLYDPKYIAVTALYIGLALLNLGLLTHRLYIIVGRNIWICAPSYFALIAILSSGIVLCVRFSQLQFLETVYTSAAQPWVLCCLSSSLFAVCYCTGMVTYRILCNENALVRVGASRMFGSGAIYALRIMIDSAGICVFPTIGLVVIYLQRSSYSLIPQFMVVPLMGIAYCLILIRTDGKRREDAAQPQEDFFGGQSTIVFRANEISDNETMVSPPMIGINAHKTDDGTRTIDSWYP